MLHIFKSFEEFQSALATKTHAFHKDAMALINLPVDQKEKMKKELASKAAAVSQIQKFHNDAMASIDLAVDEKDIITKELSSNIEALEKHVHDMLEAQKSDWGMADWHNQTDAQVKEYVGNMLKARQLPWGIKMIYGWSNGTPIEMRDYTDLKLSIGEFVIAIGMEQNTQYTQYWREIHILMSLNKATQKQLLTTFIVCQEYSGFDLGTGLLLQGLWNHSNRLLEKFTRGQTTWQEDCDTEFRGTPGGIRVTYDFDIRNTKVTPKKLLDYTNFMLNVGEFIFGIGRVQNDEYTKEINFLINLQDKDEQKNLLGCTGMTTTISSLLRGIWAHNDRLWKKFQEERAALQQQQLEQAKSNLEKTLPPQSTADATEISKKAVRFSTDPTPVVNTNNQAVDNNNAHELDRNRI